MTNTTPTGGCWTGSISHRELIRAGSEEKLEVNSARLRFIFQGVLDNDHPGKQYGQVRWRLRLLELVNHHRRPIME